MVGRTFARKLSLLAILVVATSWTSIALAETPLAALNSGLTEKHDVVGDDSSLDQRKLRELKESVPANDEEAAKNDEEGDSDGDDKSEDSARDSAGDNAGDSEGDSAGDNAEDSEGKPDDENEEKDENVAVKASESGEEGNTKDSESNHDADASDNKNDGEDPPTLKEDEKVNNDTAKIDEPTKKPSDGGKKTPEIDNRDDEGGNGGTLFFLLVLLIGLCTVGFKHKDKITPIIQGLVDTASSGFDPNGGGGLPKSTKYEQVASNDTNDEEWGWGDGATNNGGNSNGDDDDDWGDDDWDDDMGTTNKKNIEMTAPSFSSNNSYNDTNMVQRRPSSGDEDDVVGPPPKSLSLISKSSNGGRSGGLSLNSNSSKGFDSAPPSRLSPIASTQGIPGTIGGMTMGITSLAKKKPATKVPKKPKKLLGASDEDLFATMGFGGPPSKPKPKALPSKFALAASKPPPKSKNSPFQKAAVVAAPNPSPFLIPDGFDDDDLGLDDDLGGDDDWGDNDDDLDDLLAD